MVFLGGVVGGRGIPEVEGLEGVKETGVLDTDGTGGRRREDFLRGEGESGSKSASPSSKVERTEKELETVVVGGVVTWQGFLRGLAGALKEWRSSAPITLASSSTIFLRAGSVTLLPNLYLSCLTTISTARSLSKGLDCLRIVRLEVRQVVKWSWMRFCRSVPA